MFGPKSKKNLKEVHKEQGTPLRTDHTYRHHLLPEEFPEGPYGSPMAMEVSREWLEDDHRVSAFEYTDKTLHQGIPRHLPPVDESYGEVPEGNDGQP
ncbi:MAG: hypothetical protein RBR24_00520 [Candidatus Carbobacillus sp.]|nr:hypothetical protein [Candidatus Carbobacillus sp.]